MTAEIDGKKGWICPSDRELTLRSKLNTGWSSQTYFYKPEPILEAEFRSIERVIERAKEADYVEKERVRKLVCKLENMKRNSMGDGRNTCSMCGVNSGWLRTSFIQCSDCFMVVCEKCRIDINNSFEECVLCKICSEQREVWKKSGAWFYGMLPSVENLNYDELKCYQTSGSDTWEHRARDIVRLESFEAPEKTLGNELFYKTWAINSSPDLNELDDAMILNKYNKRKYRKSSEGVQIETHMLPLPILHISKLSASCPALQEKHREEVKIPTKGKKIFLRKKFLKPARKIVNKIKNNHKIFN